MQTRWEPCPTKTKSDTLDENSSAILGEFAQKERVLGTRTENCTLQISLYRKRTTLLAIFHMNLSLTLTHLVL